jgi:SAM-dependent methyltransferase
MAELELTGERLVCGKSDPELETEHRARYAWAALFVRRHAVLDYGCGSGYGSTMLASAGARRVVGSDRAPAAVLHAAARYGGPGVSFCATDCSSSAFAGGRFEVVVAFEVIEHLDDHRGFLREVRRLLVPGGVLLLSTPNRATYRQGPDIPPNPFHRCELDLEELRAMLSEAFPAVAILGQVRTEGTWVFAADGESASGVVDLPPTLLRDPGAAGARLESADYLLAACSDDPAVVRAAPCGGRLFLAAADDALRRRDRRIVELQEELEGRTRWALGLQGELEVARTAHAAFESRLGEAEGAGSRLGDGDEAPAAPPASAPRPAFPDGHFYSPVVDPGELGERADAIWSAPAFENPSVDYRADAQRHLLAEVAPYAADFDYPLDRPDAARGEFFERNGRFEGLDARMHFCLLRHFRPRLLVEVGSGFSSLLAADVNHRFLGGGTEVLCIDPHPPPFLRHVAGLGGVLASRVQDVPEAVFARLAAGDLLFVDSSHVSKTGSDVNAIYLRILPVLRRGVLLHVHDVFLPEEYPREWVLGEQRSWNEQYLVHALLAYSSGLEILFASHYASRRFPELVERTFGVACGGGSLWLRKAAPGPLDGEPRYGGG